MGLLTRRAEEETESRFGMNDYLSWFSLDNSGVVPGLTWPSGGKEQISPGYQSLTAGAYSTDAVVFACVQARMLLFSEARFQFQRFNKGRPGDLYGNSALDILEHPWPNGTTGDLLARMEQDVSLAGNFFARRIPQPGGDRLERLRPDWVEIVASDPMGSPDSLGRAGSIDLLAYIYYPGGKGVQKNGITLMPDEVAHYCPIPDPLAHFRGMSWLTPVIREIEADKAMTRHTNKFFENAATPNLMIKLTQKLTNDAYERLEKALEDRYSGTRNAYRTMLLEGGADATVVGMDFRAMTFTDLQAAGENRICAASGVPPVIVGLKEGLSAATYSNYAQAMRLLADQRLRPWWRNAASCLETLVPPPSGSRLWYDDRDIPALRAAEQEEAEVLAQNSAAINSLIGAGYDPDSVINAVSANDLTLLTHTGWLSVQLWKPGMDTGGQSAKESAQTMPPGAESPKAPDGAMPMPAMSQNSDEMALALTTMRDIAMVPTITDLLERMASDTREDTNALIEAVVHQGESTKALAEVLSRKETVVNVAPAEVTVQPAEVNVQVQPPEVTVEAPNVQVDAPVVNIETPARTRTPVYDRKTGKIVRVEET